MREIDLPSLGHCKKGNYEGTSVLVWSPIVLDMLKTLLLAFAVVSAAVAFGADPFQKKDDKTPHHAAMHAEKWLDHHVSAPHHRKPTRRKRMYHNKKATVHHAVMHAEHWVDHHVSAPHKTGG